MHQLEHLFYECVYMHWRLDAFLCKRFSVHLASRDLEYVTDRDDTQHMYALGDSDVYTCIFEHSYSGGSKSILKAF